MKSFLKVKKYIYNPSECSKRTLDELSTKYEIFRAIHYCIYFRIAVRVIKNNYETNAYLTEFIQRQFHFNKTNLKSRADELEHFVKVTTARKVL